MNGNLGRVIIYGSAIALCVAIFTHWWAGFIILLGISYYTERKWKGSATEDGTRPPFLSLFGDTFKMPDCYGSKQEIKSVPCDINGNNNYDVEVVGESYYRTTIWAGIPSEYSKKDSFRIYYQFTLEFEDDNEFDSNAVAVKIKSTVGHLPKDIAKKYRRWAMTNDLGQIATCRGVIVWTKGKDYSIWLDVPI